MGESMTLGSLFDGIGGFMLAGQYAGIRPIWSSEVEPFPMRVTEIRFPEVKQLGDVHGIHGGEISPVNIITFGSPCQNLSIAGKRAGLEGAQSSMFFEAIRIIREMREKTNGRYPRWAVWENVPGALSSNDGRDYRQVLQSLAEICDQSADVSMPEKWHGAGEIMGDHYSLAWRILDASKGWGVAQRRRRIFAVLDLAGQRAGAVLFESEGVSGYTPPSGASGQGAADSAEESAGETGVVCLNDQGGAVMDISTDVAGTLRAHADGHAPCVVKSEVTSAGFCTEHSAESRGIGYAEEEAPTLRAGVVPGVAIEFNPSDSRIKVREDGQCQTLTARCGTGGNNVPLTFQQKVYGLCSDQSHAMLSHNPHSGIYEATTSRTLDTGGGDPRRNQGGMIVLEGNGARPSHQGDGYKEAETMYTLNTVEQHSVCVPVYSVRSNVNTEVQEEQAVTLEARDSKDAQIVGVPTYCMTVGSYGHIAEDKTPTLEARGYKDPPVVASSAASEYYVRRLTPLECCRLQGYPDGWTQNLGMENPSEEEIQRWTDIFAAWNRLRGGSDKLPGRNRVIKWLKDPTRDAAEYKAYGNSVAVPCIFFVLAGIVWAEKVTGGEKNEQVLEMDEK